MSYQDFTEYPLWKEASALADSVFDFSRGIEDFSLRNRMTGSAVEIPFLLGEAAQTQTDEEMKDRLWKVEDPVNELRSVLTEAKEQGFAPGADYELMQERCRNLFQKVHVEASSVKNLANRSTSAPEPGDAKSEAIVQPEPKNEATTPVAEKPAPGAAPKKPAPAPQAEDLIDPDETVTI